MVKIHSGVCTTKIGVISKAALVQLISDYLGGQEWPFTLLPLDHKIDYIIVGETNKTNSNVKWNRNRTKSVVNISPTAN